MDARHPLLPILRSTFIIKPGIIMKITIAQNTYLSVVLQSSLMALISQLQQEIMHLIHSQKTSQMSISFFITSCAQEAVQLASFFLSFFGPPLSFQNYIVLTGRTVDAYAWAAGKEITSSEPLPTHIGLLKGKGVALTE
jgi:hypothetical protein